MRGYSFLVSHYLTCLSIPFSSPLVQLSARGLSGQVPINFRRRAETCDLPPFTTKHTDPLRINLRSAKMILKDNVTNLICHVRQIDLNLISTRGQWGGCPFVQAPERL